MESSCSEQKVQRSEYRNGDTLTAASLEADGDGRNAAWQFHNKCLHSAGVISGLAVSHTNNSKIPNSIDIIVSPGAAIDPYGRMLLSNGVLKNIPTPTLNLKFTIWLRYAASITKHEGSHFNRIQDTVEIVLTSNPSPEHELARKQGVCLGECIYNPELINNISYENRSYVRAIGQNISAPSGRSKIILGPQVPTDPRQFAIEVSATDSSPTEDVLSIESGNNIRTYKTTTLAASADHTKSPSLMMTVGSVTYSADDILDPQRVWELLHEYKDKLPIDLSELAHSSTILPTKDVIVEIVNNWISNGSLKTIIPATHAAKRSIRIRRFILDRILNDSVRACNKASRAISFLDSKEVDIEPPAGRMHLVHFKQDGVQKRQLRITIPDPGEKNNPHRYRCSFGFSNCEHPATPKPGEQIWNQQTSWPRGILSVLADNSVDIHHSLSVYAQSTDHEPGIILKLASDKNTIQSSTLSPLAPVLYNAIGWNGVLVTRTAPSELVLGGILRNFTRFKVNDFHIIMNCTKKNDTGLGPAYTIVLQLKSLFPTDEKNIEDLVNPAESLKIILPDDLHTAALVVNIVASGIVDQNATVYFQQQLELR